MAPSKPAAIISGDHLMLGRKGLGLTNEAINHSEKSDAPRDSIALPATLVEGTSKNELGRTSRRQCHQSDNDSYE
jgi:hypothetical protein